MFKWTDHSFLFRAMGNKRKLFVSLTSVCVVGVSCAILIFVNGFVCLDVCIKGSVELKLRSGAVCVWRSVVEFLGRTKKKSLLVLTQDRRVCLCVFVWIRIKFPSFKKAHLFHSFNFILIRYFHLLLYSFRVYSICAAVIARLYC